MLIRVQSVRRPKLRRSGKTNRHAKPCVIVLEPRALLAKLVLLEGTLTGSVNTPYLADQATRAFGDKSVQDREWLGNVHDSVFSLVGVENYSPPTNGLLDLSIWSRIQGGRLREQPAADARFEASATFQVQVVADEAAGEAEGDPIDLVLHGRLESYRKVTHYFSGQSEIDYFSDDGNGTVVTIPSLDQPDGVGEFSESIVRESNTRIQMSIGRTIRIYAYMLREGTIPSGGSDLSEAAGALFDVYTAPPQGTDLRATSLTWDPKQGGVNFAYAIDRGDLPAETTVGLYWSKGPSWNDVIDPDTPAYVYKLNTPALRAKGSPPAIHVSRKDLGIPPKGAIYLLAVGDPSGVIKEADESNNVAALDGSLTSEQLRRIMPALSAWAAQRFLEPLKSAMRRFGINTYARGAAFLAQVALESDQLRHWVEGVSLTKKVGTKVGKGVVISSSVPQYRVKTGTDVKTVYVSGPNFICYDPKGPAPKRAKKLGNTEPGDGPKFRGRGPIQVTGRDRYTKAGAVLGLDLIAHPEWVGDPDGHADVGFLIAGWFWDWKKINRVADRVDIKSDASIDATNKQATVLVNGGYNAIDQRLAFYRKALDSLLAD
jgi:predicted chitinase